MTTIKNKCKGSFISYLEMTRSEKCLIARWRVKATLWDYSSILEDDKIYYLVTAGNKQIYKWETELYVSDIRLMVTMSVL